MYCNQKYSGAVKGFLLGGLLVFSLMFVSSNWNKNQTPPRTVSFNEALSRAKSEDIKEVRIKGETVEFLKDEQMFYATGVSGAQLQSLLREIDSNVAVSFTPEAKDPLIYLFQILFWLFFISPPVIVILLLVIIKKLDAKS